jgi:tetratricopeptide (TPR) repeat protein
MVLHIFLRLLWYKEGFGACDAKKEYFIAKTQHEPAALAHMYNNYGCLYDQKLHYDESLSYFEKAILANPKDGMYVCNLAEVYCKLNNPKKAMEAAEKAKKLGHESSTLNAILESKGLRYS